MTLIITLIAVAILVVALAVGAVLVASTRGKRARSTRWGSTPTQVAWA